MSNVIFLVRGNLVPPKVPSTSLNLSYLVKKSITCFGAKAPEPIF